MSKLNKILLGTKNKGKIKEARRILEEIDSLEILSVNDHSFPDVKEDGDTYRENSLKKARVIFENSDYPVLAEDAGLEVEVLNGSPGVYSARFAGPNATDQDNNKKLLEQLSSVEHREACFASVATLVTGFSEPIVTRGVLEGKIAREPHGSSGFGYDPLFIPNTYTQTLAQLGSELKSRISHRRQALQNMKERLQSM